MSKTKVTVQDVKEAIKSIYFFTAEDGVRGAPSTHLGAPPDNPELDSLRLLTFCTLVLQNGFTVVGASACAHPLTFSAEVGRDLALEHAMDAIWPLLGYELKTKIAGESHD